MLIWSYLFAMGAVISAVLAVGLWQRRVNRSANRILAIWLLVFLLDLAARAWFFGSNSDASIKAYGIAQFFPFIHGSTFYLYVSLLTQNRVVRWGDLQVLAGFVIVVSLNFPILLASAEETRAVFAGRSSLPSFWFEYFDITLLVYGLSYVTAALVVLARHHRDLLAQRSDHVVDQLSWVRVLGIGQLAIWTVAVLQWLNVSEWLSVNAIYATVTLWLLALGSFSVREHAVLPVSPSKQPKSIQKPSPRWDRVEEQLKYVMDEEALYAQADLTIAELAEAVGEPEYLVSAVINQRFGQTFYDFVNRRRVASACARLRAEPKANILDIALDSGFASKATFYTVFKRQTGRTPSAWRRDD